ncbi:hypothetical protein J6590_051665 [Homalodisca vitripennis]|nr:hypothetical protein J6590_051665 [Homalodisca vitripennis]
MGLKELDQRSPSRIPKMLYGFYDPHRESLPGFLQRFLSEADVPVYPGHQLQEGCQANEVTEVIPAEVCAKWVRFTGDGIASNCSQPAARMAASTSWLGGAELQPNMLASNK